MDICFGDKPWAGQRTVTLRGPQLDPTECQTRIKGILGVEEVEIHFRNCGSTTTLGVTLQHGRQWTDVQAAIKAAFRC